MRAISIPLLEDLFSLFFPDLCLGCNQPLVKGEKILCSLCQFHLPRTHYQFDIDNPLARVFWGRVKVEAAASWCFFQKGNNVQQLLHQLKYNRRFDIGIYCGESFGAELRRSPLFNDIDAIVPVPLHPVKKRKRGYNQSELFGLGLSRTMDAILIPDVLVRETNSSTQTKKTRYNRWENVENIFRLERREAIIRKNLLLVDDVITTGATLEACARELLKAEGTKIWIASIAFAYQV